MRLVLLITKEKCFKGENSFRDLLFLEMQLLVQENLSRVPQILLILVVLIELLFLSLHTYNRNIDNNIGPFNKYDL